MTKLIFQFEPHDPSVNANYALCDSKSDVEGVESAGGSFTTITPKSGSTIQFTDTGNLRYSITEPDFSRLTDTFESAKDMLSEYVDTNVAKFDVSILIRNGAEDFPYLDSIEDVEDFAVLYLPGEPNYVELSDETVMISSRSSDRSISIA